MMSLFKRLTLEGRSVTITTRVTKKIGLLDMAAVQDRDTLVFFGPPDTALEYFRVTNFTRVYDKLSKHKPGELSEKFRNSTLYNQFVSERITMKRISQSPETGKNTREPPEGEIPDPR